MNDGGPRSAAQAPNGSSPARAASIVTTEHVRIGDQRIARIKGMMARGEWFTRASTLALSEEWGIAYSTVKTYATRASSELRNVTDEAELAEIRGATIARLERLSAEAESNGELRTAVRAEETKAKVAGIITSDAQKVQIVVVLGVKVPLVEAAQTLERLVTMLAEAPGTTTLDEIRPRLAAALGASE